MRVAVGSLNEVKVKAVKNCFEKFFGKVVIEPIPIDTPPQPIGFDETLRGAVFRGSEALRLSEADYGVGLEAGLIKVPYSITGYVDQHICAIVDREEQVTLGFSMAFEFPREVVEKLLRREAGEAEGVMEEISGMRGIGEKCGAIGYLSREEVVRRNLCEQAVISALIPRLNQRLYPGRWPTAYEILERRSGR